MIRCFWCEWFYSLIHNVMYTVCAGFHTHWQSYDYLGTDMPRTNIWTPVADTFYIDVV